MLSQPFLQLLYTVTGTDAHRALLSNTRQDG